MYFIITGFLYFMQDGHKKKSIYCVQSDFRIGDLCTIVRREYENLIWQKKILSAFLYKSTTELQKHFQHNLLSLGTLAMS